MTAPSYISTHKAISDIRETNNHPVIGECEDLQDYVIKHNRGYFPCNKLVNELLASYFLRIWEIPTPEVAFVNVREQDIRDWISSFCQPGFFNIPCFGTYFYAHGLEFNLFLEKIRDYERQKFSNLTDALRIGLFDVWMANEDRMVNNPNLLIVPKEQGYEITAIDHESCFNTNNLQQGLYNISVEDSILAHPAIVQLCGAIIRNKAEIDRILEKSYLCIRKCEKELSGILSFVPAEWQVDTTRYEQLLRKHLFREEWFNSVRTNFLTILQQVNNQ